MFAAREDRPVGAYFFATTITQHGEARPGRVGPSNPLPAYFFATTIVLIVAVTPSTTSTSTM